MSHRASWWVAALVLAVVGLAPALGFPLFESPPPDLAPPQWSGQGQSLDAVPPGETVLLFASLTDDSGLARAQLWTNETGTMAPVSGLYGSPLTFYGGPRNTLALFPWKSNQLAPGTEVAWKIAFEDRAGHTNETPTLTFQVAPLPPPPPGPHETTFTVCPSGCDNTTIQDAINAATDGDTVLALNGTHSGAVVVNRSITLRGESRDNTTIDGQGATIVVRMVNTSNVSDFFVQNGTFGVQVDANGSRVERTFLNSSIAGPPNTGQGGVGILISMARDVVVDSNRVAGALGVLFAAVSKPSIGILIMGENNTITRNQVNGTDEGITTFGSSSNFSTIRDNNASDNLREGISVGAGESELVDNNTALRNGFDGIVMSNARNSTFRRNLAMFNQFGIIASEQPGINNTFVENNASFNVGGMGGAAKDAPGFDNVFINNTIRNNSLVGTAIFRTGPKNPAVFLENNSWINNTIEFNGLNPPFPPELTGAFGGISLFEANNSTIRGNTLNGNRHGIVVDRSNFNNLSGNRVANSTIFGVAIQPGLSLAISGAGGETGFVASIGNSVTGNNATNNTVGIFVNNSTDNTLDSNNASFNAEDGIRLQDAPNNSVSNNIARNNTRFGIYVNRSNNTPTSGNDARFNLHGIFYNNTTNNSVTGNTASNNTDDGIKLLSPIDSTITGNTARSNFRGIHVTNPSGSLTIAGNTFAPGNPGGNIVIDPARLVLIFGNLIFSGGFGVQLIDVADALIRGNLFQSNNVSLHLVDSANVTIQDDTICDSLSFDISMVNSTATLVNTTVDPSKVLLANSTLAGLGPPVSVNNIKIEAEGKLREDGRKMSIEAEAVVKNNRTRGEMEFQLKEREDGNKTKLSAHGEVDRVALGCGGGFQLLGNATVRETGAGERRESFVLLLSNQSATLTLGSEIFILPVKLKIEFLEPGKPGQ